MKDLTLKEAIEVAAQIKPGESMPLLGGRFFPKTEVKYLSGLSANIEQTDLVLAKNTKSIGVRNIDKDQLDFPFLVTGIRINFDTTTGALVTPESARYKDAAPAYWKNGELRISQDGVLSELPVSIIANNYAATSNDSDIFPVAPFLIREGKAFKINALLAGVAVANQAFRLELVGIEFRRNER